MRESKESNVIFLHKIYDSKSDFPFFFFIKFIANTHGFAVESEIINLKFIVTLNDKDH